MKKILITLICIISIYRANAQNVNIPDANFKAALLANTAINTNTDTEIQVSEAIAFTGNIVVSNLNIADLTGIQAFTNITNLDCSDNQLTSLDVSANTSLFYLFCNNNQLTNLDVSGCTALVELYCGFNQLTSLDVTANTALTKLYCFFNSITSLDVTANTALLELNCMFNQLTNLDVTANTALTFLHCGVNQLTNLDVTANTALTYLDFHTNQLPSIDVTANTVLINFYCGNNQLTSINVTANTALNVLYCGGNQITSLDVTANTALTDLDCSSNQLTSLDVSNNIAIFGVLYCSNNQLTSIDVSANTALTTLDCSGNQLTSLNVKNNNNINFEDFYADNNPNLNCIQVDDSTWSATNWTDIDPWAHFSTLCLTCIPIIINPVSSQTVCDSTAFIVSATVSGGSGTLNYNWNNGIIDTTALTFTIYPQATSTYTLTVTDSAGCVADSNIAITVNPLPTVTLALPSADTLLCISANAITLTGATPAGGIYSGAGVTGNSFNPSTAGLGSHTITYSYTDVNTCSNTATSSITVETCAGIIESANDHSFLLYPNPTSGQFTIVLSTDSAEIIVTNVLGQQIIKTQTAQKIANLKLDNNGVYIVYLKTKQGTITQKLIVNR